MAVSYAGTAAPAVQYISFGSNTATFSNVAIGSAASDRIVVVGVGNSNTTFSPVTSVTIGGVSASSVGNHSAFASIWWALVPTGTTATIVVSSSDTFELLGIQVAAMTGAATSGPTGSSFVGLSYQPDPYAITGVVPAGGIGIVYVSAGSPAGVTPVWTNAIGDSSSSSQSGNTEQCILAHTVASGSQTPSLSGGYNYAGAELIMALWGPGGNTYTGSASDSLANADSALEQASYFRLIGMAQ